MFLLPSSVWYARIGSNVEASERVQKACAVKNPANSAVGPMTAPRRCGRFRLVVEQKLLAVDQCPGQVLSPKLALGRDWAHHAELGLNAGHLALQPRPFQVAGPVEAQERRLVLRAALGG